MPPRLPVKVEFVAHLKRDRLSRALSFILHWPHPLVFFADMDWIPNIVIRKARGHLAIPSGDGEGGEMNGVDQYDSLTPTHFFSLSP